MSNDVRAALLRATELLAQHTGDLQHRLADAYALELSELDLTGLPADAVEQLQTLRHRLTFLGAPEISAMLIGDDEAIPMVRHIVELCMDVLEVSIADPSSRALEKFMMAARSLAESQHDLGDRLAEAVTHTVLSLAPAEVPEKLTPAFKELRRRMTHVAASGDEGTIVATCSSMSDDEARAIIAEIVRLYGALIEIGARR